MTTTQQMRVQLTMEELLRRWEYAKKVRNKCRRSLTYLCKYVLGYTDVHWEVDGDVHEDIMQNLQKFPYMAEDVLDKHGQCTVIPNKPLWELDTVIPGLSTRRTLTLYPRGHLKTSIITIAHTIQWIINYPNIRILISTATGDQCKKMLLEIKSHFQYNKLFRHWFPDFCPPAKKAADFGSQEEFTVPNRTIHRKEPTVSTCSVGKVIAGSHYEVIKNSDLVDKENVKTPGQIADVIAHFGYLNPLLERSEIAPYHGWVDVEGTRYDFGDLYGKLLATGTYRTVVRPRDDEESVWPARFPPEELKRIESEVGPYIYSCFPGDAPVLMADFTQKEIRKLAVGDQIVGFDVLNGGYPKLVPAVVECVNKRIAPVIKTVMRTGRVIYCTPEHKWLKAAHRARKLYAPLRVGMELCSVYEPPPIPTANEQRDLDWLGGILDGEGTCNVKTGSSLISQSISLNHEVHTEITSALNRLGIGFSWIDAADQFLMYGGRSLKIRLLQHARMAKRERFIKSMWRRPHRILEYRDVVESITPIGELEVFNIQSSTGNYVAYGYATKNCQMRNKPIPPEGGLCDPKDVVFLPRNIIGNLLPSLRLHTTIDLHGLEPARNNNDATALTVHGFDRDGRMYVVDIRHGRFTPDQVIWHVFDIHQRYPQMVDYKIEKDAHARVLLPFLQREASKRQRFPIMVPIKRDTHVSKQQRIRGLQPWFKAGIIRFADDLSCKTDLLLEIMQFPSQSAGCHDDILDTLADAMQNAEGGVTDDVVCDPYMDPRSLFGMEKPRNRFMQFGPAGQPEWLYGNEDKFDPGAYAPTGVM